MWKNKCFAKRIACPAFGAFLLSLLFFAGTSLGATKSDVAAEARQFLDTYNPLYQGLYTVALEAAWKSSTDVTPEHTGSVSARNKRRRSSCLHFSAVT